MSAHSSVSSEWFSGKCHHLQICLGLLYNFLQGQTLTLSPLAVSFTTSIIRSRKLVHPTAASCVREGPKAFVKYSKTTPYMSQNWMNQMNDQFELIFTLDNLKILNSQTLQRQCYCPLVTWVTTITCSACILVASLKLSTVWAGEDKSATHLSRNRNTVAVCRTNLIMWDHWVKLSKGLSLST